MSNHPCIPSQATEWSYSVKVINPKNAGGDCVESWRGEEFSSVDDIKSRLCEGFSDYVLIVVLRLDT